MFKYLAVSIVFVPVLLGLLAAAAPDPATGRRAMRPRWILFSVFWVGLLYYLRYRWQ